MILKYISIVGKNIQKYICSQTKNYSTQNNIKQLELVKHLRKITNEGVSSCKNALVENNWDIKLAAEYILGKQESKSLNFDLNKLNYGRISYLQNSKRRGVAVEVKTDCDIVASTQLFETVARKLASSLLAHIEEHYRDYFTNKSHIFNIDSSHLDSIPVRDSKQVTLKNLLNRASSQFGRPIVVDNLYICHTKENELIGSYTHNTVSSNIDEIKVGSRLGLVNIGYKSDKGLKHEFLKQISDFIALQAVGDPNYCSMDEFLSLKVLKYDQFNKILSEVSNYLNIKGVEIDPNTTLRESLEVIRSLKLSEIRVNSILYINSGKNFILLN